jgi:hypothetical protein
MAARVRPGPATEGPVFPNRTERVLVVVVAVVVVGGNSEAILATAGALR